jgi:hypothetical protein
MSEDDKTTTNSLNKWVTVGVWILVGAFLLLFTPVGGVVNLVVGGLCGIGGVILILKAPFDWYDDGLRKAGTSLGFGLALLFICLLLQMILPRPPISGSSDCIATRSTPWC